MPTKTAELLYSNAVKWIRENPQDQHLSHGLASHQEISFPIA